MINECEGPNSAKGIKHVQSYRSHTFLLLLLSSVSSIFFDSCYLPMIAILHQALYLAFIYSCTKSRWRIFGWFVVSLCRAVPASDYFSNGVPRTIAYAQTFVVIAAIYGIVTIAMVIQCCVWADHERYIDLQKGSNVCRHENPTEHPNEMTPLRAATSTLESSASDDGSEHKQEQGSDKLHKENDTFYHMECTLSFACPKDRSFTLIHQPRLSPLVFPTLFTSIFQLVFRSPIGGAGNPAMGLTQVNGLRQIVSISGEISLVFWIGWLASIIVGSGVINSPSSPKKTKNRIPGWHLLTFIALTFTMFIFGCIRERSGLGFYLEDIAQWPSTKANEAPLKVSCVTRARIKSMIDRTNERLAAGDDLIIWSEAASQYAVSPQMFEWNDENTGAVIATTSYEQIQGSRKFYNRVQMMQKGQGIASYAKNRPVPIIESYVMQGPQAPYTTNVTFTPRLATCGGGSRRGYRSQMSSINYCTASGKPPRQELDLKTTNAICFDVDFPYLLGQAHDADLAIAPSWYWASIGQILWEHNKFRAIENGFTLIKCSEYGISGAVDPFGRTISALPTLNDEVYSFEVPVQKGVETVFENGGWAFGWICVGLSPLLLLLTVVGRYVKSTNRFAGSTQRH